MKIFIGHSFKKEDRDIVERIIKFIQSLKMEYITGEQSEILSVSQKVQERINKCDIFIGIFTKEKPLEHHFWEKSIPYTTSSWVIQESGYALAKCKKVIFLFEEPVFTRLGLQADSEYLVFDRNKPLDSMFTKLNEMLINNDECTNFDSDIFNNQDVNSLPQNKEADINNVTTDNISNQNNQDSHKIDLVINLNYSNNYELVKQSYDELINMENDDETKTNYKATFLYRSELLGIKGSVEQLQKLSEQYQENTFIKAQLANYYKKLQAFDKASLLYKEIANSIQHTEKLQTYADIIYQENCCIALNSSYNEALQNIKNILKENYNNHYLYRSIALLAHDNNDWSTFFNYAECYLKREPDDTDIRFKLAYAYSDQKQKKLSFYHYKILNSTSRSGTYCNNIGVLYDNFELNVKSVNAYKKAIELDESLSISNLANLYINAGFIEEAKNLMSKIEDFKQRHITIHENIGNTESRIKKAELSETEKEKNIFDDAQKQYSFMQEYAEKYCTAFAIDYSSLSGVWNTHKGEFLLEFKENFECKFKINLKSESEYTEFGIKGKIANLSIYANIKTMEHNSVSYNDRKGLFSMYLGSLPGDKLFGIISEDYSKIKICVIDEKEVANYYTWEKIK